MQNAALCALAKSLRWQLALQRLERSQRLEAPAVDAGWPRQHPQRPSEYLGSASASGCLQEKRIVEFSGQSLLECCGAVDEGVGGGSKR